MMISIVSMVGIRVAIVSMVGISMAIVSMSIAIVSIGSISSGLGISRPLAIVVSMAIGVTRSIVSKTISTIEVSIISMETMAIAIGAIEDTSISTCFSFTSSSGEHAQGNNSNGFHHFQCLQARGFS